MFCLLWRLILPNCDKGGITELSASGMFDLLLFSSLSEGLFCTRLTAWVNYHNVLLLVYLILVQKSACDVCQYVMCFPVFSRMLKDVPSNALVTIVRLSIQPMGSWQPVSHAHLRVQSTSCTIRSVCGPCVVGQCTRLCTSHFVV